jgi:hypothetical protein
VDKESPTVASPAEPEAVTEPSGNAAQTDVPATDVQVSQRLDHQLVWYGLRSRHHKRWYLSLKIVQIVVAAAIPVVAAAGASAPVAGALGAVIVVLEGVQQLFQFHQNWISYRATAEALNHEKYLHLARAGPYAAAARPDALLAERVEALVSEETAAWAEAQRGTSAGTDADGRAA